MKLIKNTLKETTQIRVIQFVVVLFIILFALISSSCTTTYTIPTQNYIKSTEALDKCNPNDRVVIDYSKNMRKYICLDGCYSSVWRVRIDDVDTLSIGDFLIAIDIYR